MKKILVIALVLGGSVGARAQGLGWVEPTSGEVAEMVAGEAIATFASEH